jgi:hypothetical protein
MRSAILTFFLLTLLAAQTNALDLNVDLGVGVGRGEGTSGWSVEICRALTEAKHVKIEAAEPGSKERDTVSWDRAATRNEGNLQELPLPSRFRDLGKIWVQATGEPKDSEVHMAVLHEGKPKRVYSFRNSKKDHISIKDPDVDFDCPKR